MGIDPDNPKRVKDVKKITRASNGLVGKALNQSSRLTFMDQNQSFKECLLEIDPPSGFSLQLLDVFDSTQANRSEVTRAPLPPHK